MAKSSKSPSGLSIKRNTDSYTCSWKRGESYKNQQFQYRINSGSWKSLSIGHSASSKVISVKRADYYPNKNNKYLTSISFRVRGQTKGKKWSGWNSKTFTINVPRKPSVSQTLSEDHSNVTTFTWSILVDHSDSYAFTNYEYQSIRADDSNENDGSKLAWNNNAAGWLTGNGTTESYSREITEDTTVLAKGSHTRWFRVRSRGPRGASAWAYAKHVYSIPNAAIIKSATADITEAGGFVAHVEWEAPTSNAYPIDNTTVQYSITTPDINMGYPDGGSWENANVSRDTEETDGATFSIDGALNEDQCLFVRVNTEHDSQITYGIPAIAAVGRTANPTGLSVQTDTSTHRATITATNNSSIEDSFLVVLFATASEPDKAFSIGIIPKTQNSITVQCPDWGDEVISFGVYSAVGSYTQTEREDGVSAYAVEEKMRSIETIWEGGKIPVAPSNVNVSATPTTGTVMVTWDWAWEDANVAELSWADHADAWESTDEPDDYRITNLHASQWNIAGLETGKKWYIRVRLIKETESGETASPYSAIASIDLSSAPAIPSLSLSAGVIAETDTVTAYWSYITTDGTLQSYAEICEAEITANGIVYGDIIAHTESAQHITINPHDAGWEAGETHNLCVRVVSGAGRQSDGWSAPVPIIIAEPLTAEITQTSLVTQDIDVNPRTFTGNPIQFTTELEETVTDLEVTLEPQQDLNGYDHPWVGGAGKNKLNLATNPTVLTGTIPSAVTITSAEGTATIVENYYSRDANKFGWAFSVKEGETYTISGNVQSTAPTTIKVYAESGDLVYSNNVAAGIDFTRSFNSGTNSTLYFYASVSSWGQKIEMTNVQIELGSTATDYEPYSNVCPISGWDSADVWGDSKYAGLIDWNQLVGSLPSTVTRNGITFTNMEDGSIAVNGTATAEAIMQLVGSMSVIAGHKYLLKGCPPNGSYGTYSIQTSGNQDLGEGCIINNTATVRYVWIRLASGTVANNLVFTPQIFDLTQMFGEGNEPSTVEEFKSLFPKDYYPYNAGGETVVGAVNGDAYIHNTATFDETVYGGDYDFVGGDGQSTMQLDTYTGDDITSVSTASGVPFARIVASNLSTGITTDMLCNTYTPSSASANGNIVWVSRTQQVVRVFDERFTDLATAKAILDEAPIEYCYPLAEPRTIQLDPQTINTLVGVNNVWGDGDIKMRIAEASRQALCLTEMPLTVTVKGAGEGTTSLVIERAAEYHVDRPDETEFTGFDKEPVAQMTQTGEAQMTITTDDVYGALDDEAQYRIVATVQDGLGQSSTVLQEFEVHWAHQAVEPTAGVRMEDGVAVISAQKPSEWLEGDVIDIYRLSADKPELIIKNGDFGVEYVDPYPTIGEFGGHRVVYKTGNGDYIDHYNIPAWVDLGEENGDIFNTEYTLIDFDGEQIQLEYDIDLSDNWEKDFQETRYMGGSIEGDWNAGIKRSSSLSSTTINIVDQDTILALRRLADYEGQCHLRTLDGSSFSCDIQVAKSDDSDKYNKVSNFSFSITKVDPQELDGITYEMWLEGQDELE